MVKYARDRAGKGILPKKTRPEPGGRGTERGVKDGIVADHMLVDPAALLYLKQLFNSFVSK